MITPALLIIPLVHFAGRKTEHPRVKGVLQTVVVASAGLLLAAAIPLARDALTDPVTIAIAVVSLVVLLTTTIDTLWIILALGVGGRRAYEPPLGPFGGLSTPPIFRGQKSMCVILDFCTVTNPF